jgi:hypothetical protein
MRLDGFDVVALPLIIIDVAKAGVKKKTYVSQAQLPIALP